MKKVLCSLATIVFLTLSASTVFAGFVQDSFGLKYDVGGGRYLENGWAWCDPTGTGIGYSYYFTPTGYILVNTVAPDGNLVDAAGRLTVNGVVMTKIIEAGGYELNTASYLAEAPSTQTQLLNASLANRITQKNNAQVTAFSYGVNTCYDAIEFTEGVNPYIMFNSGTNRSLTFDLTGDNIDQPGDFAVDVYVNGVFSQRFTQRFVDLTTNTITFAPNQNIEIRVPIINDYYEQYIRRIYILNSYFS